MLNPYFDNRLEEIEVRNIILAASLENLEEFILQYVWFDDSPETGT